MEGLKRGAIILLAAPGDYGKPRPALVVQSNLFLQAPSLTYCPITSEVRPELERLRLTLSPSSLNGLKKTSAVMIDKVSTVQADRAKEVIGHLMESEQHVVDAALKLWLGL